jgi:hypothetical protein
LAPTESLRTAGVRRHAMAGAALDGPFAKNKELVAVFSCSTAPMRSR